MKKIIFLFLLISIPCFSSDWRLQTMKESIPNFKYSKLKKVCRFGILYYKYSGLMISIPVLDKNEREIKCTKRT